MTAMLRAVPSVLRGARVGVCRQHGAGVLPTAPAALQYRTAAAAAAAPPKALDRNDLNLVVAQIKAKNAAEDEDASEDKLELDEIYEVAKIIVNCLQSEVFFFVPLPFPPTVLMYEPDFLHPKLSFIEKAGGGHIKYKPQNGCRESTLRLRSTCQDFCISYSHCCNLQSQVQLSAVELLVQRAEVNDDKRLTLEQLQLFNSAFLGKAPYSGPEEHKARVVDALLFDAVFRSFAPEGSLPAELSERFLKVAFLGKPPAAALDVVRVYTTPFGKDAIMAALESAQVKLPTYHAQEVFFFFCTICLLFL